MQRSISEANLAIQQSVNESRKDPMRRRRAARPVKKWQLTAFAPRCIVGITLIGSHGYRRRSGGGRKASSGMRGQ